MTAPSLEHAAVQDYVRGRAYHREAEPGVIASELAGLPAAHERRRLQTTLAALMFATPGPLLAVPIALAIAGLLDPGGFVVVAAPLLLCVLLAWGVFATRGEPLPLDPMTRHAVALLSSLRWAPGVAASVQLPRKYPEPGTTGMMWQVEGVVADGHRARLSVHHRHSSSVVKVQRRRRAQPSAYRLSQFESATTELTLWPTPELLPAVHEKGRIVAAADGAAPEVTVSADSISWSKVYNDADRHDGRSVATALAQMVHGLGGKLSWCPRPKDRSPPRMLRPDGPVTW